MAKVVLMVGPSGSGKSTYAWGAFPGYLVLNADSIRKEIAGDESDQSRNAEVFALFRRRFAAALRKGHSVVVDNTNVEAAARAELYRLAAPFGAQVEARVMGTALDVCLARNAERDRKVPEAVIRRQFAAHLETLAQLPRESALVLVKIAES